MIMASKPAKSSCRKTASSSSPKDPDDIPIDTAMVLAAGFGYRMRPITNRIPKALVQVCGRALIDYALDRLQNAEIKKTVVNVHYLGEQVERHLRRRQRPRIVFSREESLLETGGGITKALPLLGERPFFAVNADTLWLNSNECALARLKEAWNDAKMDALLLLHHTVDAYGYDGMGDFLVDAVGRVERRPPVEVSPYVFTGVQILHPRLFEGARVEPFSLNVLYDKAIENGRLYAIVHDGEWLHVGSPEGLATAERYMHERYPGVKRR
ncbi:MurNAc alpha-1-phosphate uridylyltransferase [Varunaivibrio sulfuroxidans]|uniref:MurNAc alpha-1-phosphate uridylyltransferase n=2 Tax=Varunaivibrio sulfuroxidans TaxID=1773489 RepID=A0A4R3J9L1_9PROT|nr:MurNAc alpha-1-phosphate uridylyltransferase [Varunaivibrio sulfuroxidans]